MSDVAPGTSQRPWLAVVRKRNIWKYLHSGSPVVPFDPAAIPNLGLWLESDLGIISTVAPIPADATTVTVAANVGTFSASMDNMLKPSVGDIVTIAGVNYAVGARTSALIWALTGANVAVASVFTVTKPFPRVTAWNDQSGNLRHMLAAADTITLLASPLLRPIPSLDFANTFTTANGQGMTVPVVAPTLGQNQPGFTAVYVATGSATSNGALALGVVGGTASKYVARIGNLGGSIQITSRRVTAEAPTLNQIVASALTRGVYVFTVDYPTRTHEVYKDGVLLFTGPAAYAVGAAFENVTRATSLTTGSNFELILGYERALTPAERSTITVAAGAKYGIAVTP